VLEVDIQWARGKLVAASLTRELREWLRVRYGEIEPWICDAVRASGFC
jgi:hypothetical protein